MPYTRPSPDCSSRCDITVPCAMSVQVAGSLASPCVEPGLLRCAQHRAVRKIQVRALRHRCDFRRLGPAADRPAPIGIAAGREDEWWRGCQCAAARRSGSRFPAAQPRAAAANVRSTPGRLQYDGPGKLPGLHCDRCRSPNSRWRLRDHPRWRTREPRRVRPAAMDPAGTAHTAIGNRASVRHRLPTWARTRPGVGAPS